MKQRLSPNKYLLNPFDEETTHIKKKGQVTRLKNMALIGLWDKLDEFQKDKDKQTKYAMIALVRPEDEERYCIGTTASLQFAQSIAQHSSK